VATNINELHQQKTEHSVSVLRIVSLPREKQTSMSCW